MLRQGENLAVSTNNDDESVRDWTLSQCVSAALARYFRDLDGADAEGVFDMVMDEVEKPLLEAVMAQAEYNQTKAAKMLGINRGTLRKKLAHHGLE